MQELQLTNGYATKIDDADYEWASQYRWFGHAVGSKVYVGTTERCVTGGGPTVYLHRLIAGATGKVVDHIDGDTLNNCRSNLRACMARENAINRRKLKGSSKYRGVYWHAKNGKWSVRIMSHGRSYFLGLFESEKAGAIAYNRAARRLFGEFARLNEVA